jgi:hypothetical protein
MRYAFISLMLVGILLAVLIGTADEAELASFDPFRPVTVVPIVVHRVQKVPAAVRSLVDAFTAAYRQHIERTTTPPPGP